MAARKSKAQTRAEDRILHITTGAGRRSGPRDSNIPDVYSQLLSEASDPSGLEHPPVKRRRVGGGTRPQPGAELVSPASPHQPGTAVHNPQTVIDSDESEDSDFEWEETGVGEAAVLPEAKGDGSLGDISIEVLRTNTTPKRAKRKPLTTADRSLALAVHQTHVSFLLFHAHVRNKWCNLKLVETPLRGILSAKIIKLLHPDPTWVQLRQSDSFLEGLKLAVDIWRAKFKVTVSGLTKAKWVDASEELDERRSKTQQNTESIDKPGFIKAANSLQGSQDLGNQLFCALLRAVGVEARLVCSLQPLPLTMTAQARSTTPRKEKPQKSRVYATFESEQDTTSTDEDLARTPATGNITRLPPRTSAKDAPHRRLGQPSFGGPIGNYNYKPEPAKKKSVQRLEYPVFWAEALNPAYQHWVTVDPIVTGTVGRSAKLEPPTSYELNVMTYVFAFEDNSVAKDVTRRYAKAFNAKTRKLRLESTTHGQKWLNKVAKPFKSLEITDRDQIEEAELTKKEAQEGLPKNIQDFKDHPHYALERHLKRNEHIWPRREVGKINVGKSSVNNLEPIFRRIDVQIVQSADKWYRSGRDIKSKQQPMKHVPARARRTLSPSEQDGEAEMTALYAYSQTEPYIPPPVFQGRIPKNAYGNIDIYTPSMVPAGAVHVKHPLAKKAAQLLRIDFADAVTGFQFKGRHGTAIVVGVVVALENKEAIESVITGFENAMQQEEDDLRSFECLRLWRRFLLGLQIAQRIGLTDIYAANDEKAKELKEELDEADDEQEDVVEAGGFFPDQGADDIIEPTGHLFQQSKTHPQAETSDDANNLHSERVRPARRKRRLLDDDEEDDSTTYNPGVNTASECDANKAVLEPDLEVTNADDIYQRRSRSRSHLSAVSPAQNSTDGEFIHTDEQSESVTKHNDHGSGYIPMEEDSVSFSVHSDKGGGFVAAEEIPGSSEASGHVAGEVLPPGTDGEELGGGFMPEEAEMDADVRPEETKLDEDILMGGSHTAALVEAASAGGSSPDKEDQASLLSHDPDDEDAEPDWLEPD